MEVFWVEVNCRGVLFYRENPDNGKLFSAWQVPDAVRFAAYELKEGDEAAFYADGTFAIPPK